MDRSLRWMQIMERGEIDVPATTLIDPARGLDVEAGALLESSTDRAGGGEGVLESRRCSRDAGLASQDAP